VVPTIVSIYAKYMHILYDIIRIYTYNLYNPLLSKNTHVYMHAFFVL